MATRQTRAPNPPKQKAFSDVRASMSLNPLLVHAKVGRAAPSTQFLPPEDFVYGISKHDPTTVHQIISEWGKSSEKKPRTSLKKSMRPKKDFVRTNKEAVRKGCISARDFRKFQTSTSFFVRPQENTNLAEKEAYEAKIRSISHGIHTKTSDEMDDCLTYRTLRESKARAISAREAMKADKSKKQSPHIFRSSRPTEASKGHIKRPPPPPTEAQTFKIARFKNIDHYAIKDKW